MNRYKIVSVAGHDNKSGSFSTTGMVLTNLPSELLPNIVENLVCKVLNNLALTGKVFKTPVDQHGHPRSTKIVTHLLKEHNNAQNTLALNHFLNFLEILDLWENNIGVRWAIEIGEALRANKTLTILNLGANGIGDAGATAIVGALRGNTTLTSLDLGVNGIGDEGAAEIAVALKENSALESLSLEHNDIGDEGATEIAGALKVNTTLTSLYLDGNGIGDEAKKQLRDVGISLFRTMAARFI